MKWSLILSLCLAAAFSTAACAQASGDKGLKDLNSCLSQPSDMPVSEEDILKAMDPAINDSDKVAWCLFLYVNGRSDQPHHVRFETWATDGNTFSLNPRWPQGPQPKVLRANILLQVREAQRPMGLGREGRMMLPLVLPLPPNSNNVEEVRRNKPAFDFIVRNGLYTRSGLTAEFKKLSEGFRLLTFPTDSIEVKANWFPVIDPKDRSKSGIPGYAGSPGDARKVYYVNTASDGKQYALVSMHIISKIVPNWTWATFEHENNPGRCEYIGCHDDFGSQQHLIPPDTTIPDPTDTTYQNPKNNPTPYPPCQKSAALKKLFDTANVDSVFTHYCLKGSQEDFTDASGAAIRLGNSFTEEGFDFQASCMTCHGRAAFGPDGAPTSNAGFDNVTGAPLGPIHGEWFWSTSLGGPWAPSVLPTPGLKQLPAAESADFVWSIAFCAIDDSETPPKPSICVHK